MQQQPATHPVTHAGGEKTRRREKNRERTHRKKPNINKPQNPDLYKKKSTFI